MTQRGEKSYPYQDLKSDPSVLQSIASSYTNCIILALVPYEIVVTQASLKKKSRDS
jgi:hypothetical protein